MQGQQAIPKTEGEQALGEGQGGVLVICIQTLKVSQQEQSRTLN